MLLKTQNNRVEEFTKNYVVKNTHTQNNNNRAREFTNNEKFISITSCNSRFNIMHEQTRSPDSELINGHNLLQICHSG